LGFPNASNVFVAATVWFETVCDSAFLNPAWYQVEVPDRLSEVPGV
jgi:hypothetical protein